jgi:hypothetical protein
VNRLSLEKRKGKEKSPASPTPFLSRASSPLPAWATAGPRPSPSLPLFLPTAQKPPKAQLLRSLFPSPAWASATPSAQPARAPAYPGPLATARSAQPTARPLPPRSLPRGRCQGDPTRQGHPFPRDRAGLELESKLDRTAVSASASGPLARTPRGRPIKPRRLSRVSPKPPSCPVRANPSPEHRRRRKPRVAAAPALRRLQPSPKHRGFDPVG